ncbi:MAG: endonuclease/exonuclease/phosphatase family protein [Cyclobacteriaceae bacterium]|nr:endonuclease/exonuclease/phosphatase family protein [Cyclobacteriaceae bacterium HetDA_MAG_MS6]
MPKKFSVLSWNVKHFGSGSRDDKGHLKSSFVSKVQRVTQLIKSKEPDIIAIYEVKGEDVFFEFMNHFENYSFYITEGQQTQEILLGIKSNLTAFVTQRLEFKAANPHLRPGLLATISVDQVRYSLLFLHLKSINDPYGWGLRDFMWEKMRSLKGVLNKIAGGSQNSRFIVLGDLNTMGMNLIYSNKDFDGDEEVARFDDMVRSAKYDMRRLKKTYELTYTNESGTTQSNLDHVYATNNIAFNQFNGKDVEVIGWPEKQTAGELKQWVTDYSDHAMLYFEVN